MSVMMTPDMANFPAMYTARALKLLDEVWTTPCSR